MLSAADTTAAAQTDSIVLDGGDRKDEAIKADMKAKRRKAATLTAVGFQRGAPGFSSTLERIVIDMFRDMVDVQFYTGEYASKKFEVSRNMLPELYTGVQKLEAEEQEREVPPGNQQRALSILRRLAFGMQRCVAKSNGEMAYQILYQQEQFVTYSGYNMFFRFVPWAIMQLRADALNEAGAVDNFHFFEFERHYPHFGKSVQDNGDTKVAAKHVASYFSCGCI